MLLAPEPKNSVVRRSECMSPDIAVDPCIQHPPELHQFPWSEWIKLSQITNSQNSRGPNTGLLYIYSGKSSEFSTLGKRCGTNQLPAGVVHASKPPIYQTRPTPSLPCRSVRLSSFLGQGSTFLSGPCNRGTLAIHQMLEDNPGTGCC